MLQGTADFYRRGLGIACPIVPRLGKLDCVPILEFRAIF